MLGTSLWIPLNTLNTECNLIKKEYKELILLSLMAIVFLFLVASAQLICRELERHDNIYYISFTMYMSKIAADDTVWGRQTTWNTVRVLFSTERTGVVDLRSLIEGVVDGLGFQAIFIASPYLNHVIHIPICVNVNNKVALSDVLNRVRT